MNAYKNIPWNNTVIPGKTKILQKYFCHKCLIKFIWLSKYIIYIIWFCIFHYILLPLNNFCRKKGYVGAVPYSNYELQNKINEQDKHIQNINKENNIGLKGELAR